MQTDTGSSGSFACAVSLITIVCQSPKKQLNSFLLLSSMASTATKRLDSQQGTSSATIGESMDRPSGWVARAPPTKKLKPSHPTGRTECPLCYVDADQLEFAGFTMRLSVYKCRQCCNMVTGKPYVTTETCKVCRKIGRLYENDKDTYGNYVEQNIDAEYCVYCNSN